MFGNLQGLSIITRAHAGYENAMMISHLANGLGLKTCVIENNWLLVNLHLTTSIVKCNVLIYISNLEKEEDDSMDSLSREWWRVMRFGCQIFFFHFPIPDRSRRKSAKDMLDNLPTDLRSQERCNGVNHAIAS